MRFDVTMRDKTRLGRTGVVEFEWRDGEGRVRNGGWSAVWEDQRGG